MVRGCMAARRREANTDTNISDSELEAIQDQVDAEIERHGLPTDDELLLEVEKLNKQE